MIATVRPSSIGGSIQVPTSKSAMQRALAASLIRVGRTLLRNPGHSADDLAALRCIRALGATVTCHPDLWVVDSQGIRPTAEQLDCGESGLSIRMFTPLAALSATPMRIVGAGSLAKRPMHFFEHSLPALGVQVALNKGHLPIDLIGPLKPANISVDGSLSSQFLTGMLMAYSAAATTDVMIEVNDLKSRPYIDLTIEVLDRFGLSTPRNDSYERFYFDAPKPRSEVIELDYSVESDWSGASFWYAAAAIAGKIELRGLDRSSAQADRAIDDLCRSAGMGIHLSESHFQIDQGLPTAFAFDATDCPDLFPPLVALASHINGVSVIHGTERLTHKESDRANTLKSEFGKLGITIELRGNDMLISGGTGMRGGVVSSHGDHRIAMALAVAALGAESPVQIEEAESVRKSYPDFWNDLQSVGASLSLTD